jgi:hypothetical protein
VVAHAALVIQAFSPVRVYLPSAHAPLSDDGRHLHQAPPGGRGGWGIHTAPDPDVLSTTTIRQRSTTSGRGREREGVVFTAIRRPRAPLGS